MSTLVFIAYAALVAFLSLRPMSGPSIEPWDKLFHLIIYCIFALLGYRVVNGRRPFLLLCGGILVYGALLEFAQSTMPDRVGSPADMLANLLGVVLAVAAVRQAEQPSDGSGRR